MTTKAKNPVRNTITSAQRIDVDTDSIFILQRTFKCANMNGYSRKEWSSLLSTKR